MYATRSKETADNVLIVGSMAFDDLELPSVNAKDVVGGLFATGRVHVHGSRLSGQGAGQVAALGLNEAASAGGLLPEIVRRAPPRGFGGILRPEKSKSTYGLLLRALR